PPRRVDQDAPPLHLRQGSGVDEVMTGLVEVAMEADEVALLQQVVEPERPPDAQGLLGAGDDIRVVEHDIQPERLGPERRSRADPATADDPEGLAAEPGGGLGGAVIPAALAAPPVGAQG